MFTIFTLLTGLEKVKLDSSLSLDLGLPCCLVQLLDLWQINSMASSSNKVYM